jgi:hypothetical protein
MPVCLFLAVGAWRCAEPEAPPEPPIVDSLSLAVYHAGIGSWIVPQNDPYALDNFQRAWNNLTRGEATRALEPTHLALKIFPRSEDEQWEIELMENVEISYIPFTWVALTEEQVQELEQTEPEKVYFPEVSPHVVTYDELTTIEGEMQEGVYFDMPILYAAWPVDKPLPDHLDYETDYEVFIPNETQTRGGTPGGDLMRRIEEEAVRLALGHSAPRAASKTRASAVLSGDFWDWEVLRSLRIPIPGLTVKFRLGSKIVETDADENGHFSVAASQIPSESSWEIVFQNPKWKVTRENSTIPKSFFQGAVYQANNWSEANSHVSTALQPQDATIIKALNYYYYHTHNLTKWEYTGGIHVIADPNSSTSYNGLFTYSSSNNCYITIYRNNTGDNKNVLMGTVFHEMGHFIHFKERGGTYKSMKNVDRLLQESFASYVGWYMTEKYYNDLGYVKTSTADDISKQARQTSWTQSENSDWGYYSPLFVDLVDNYDQSSSNSRYNRDAIKEVHYSVIMQIAQESETWESCKSILYAKVPDRNITARDLDTFLAPYNYWYSH